MSGSSLGSLGAGILGGGSLFGRLVRQVIVATALSAVALLVGRSAQAQPEENWATKQAANLTEMGERSVAAGQVEQGIRRLLQAIQMDATYAPAYLTLAKIRVQQGETREALVAYNTALEHIPDLAAAYLGRAELRERAGSTEAAIGDLRQAHRLRPTDLVVLKDLERLMIAARWFPAALAVARRRRWLALSQGDLDTARSARITAVALSRLVGAADPVTAGDRGDWVRRALAELSR